MQASHKTQDIRRIQHACKIVGQISLTVVTPKLLLESGVGFQLHAVDTVHRDGAAQDSEFPPTPSLLVVHTSRSVLMYSRLQYTDTIAVASDILDFTRMLLFSGPL